MISDGTIDDLPPLDELTAAAHASITTHARSEWCLKKIRSGGQTGADIAGLRAGRALRLETGGWAARGWLTERGPNPRLALFGLVQHEGGYPERTDANVRDSDGTVRIARDFTSPGEIRTKQAIDGYSKPYLDIPLALLQSEPSTQAARLRRFLTEHRVAELNVAGNAESTAPGIELAAGLFLAEALQPPAAGRPLEAWLADVPAELAKIKSAPWLTEEHVHQLATDARFGDAERAALEARPLPEDDRLPVTACVRGVDYAITFAGEIRRMTFTRSNRGMYTFVDPTGNVRLDAAQYVHDIPTVIQEEPEARAPKKRRAAPAEAQVAETQEQGVPYSCVGTDRIGASPIEDPPHITELLRRLELLAQGYSRMAVAAADWTFTLAEVAAAPTQVGDLEVLEELRRAKRANFELVSAEHRVFRLLAPDVPPSDDGSLAALRAQLTTNTVPDAPQVVDGAVPPTPSELAPALQVEPRLPLPDALQFALRQGDVIDYLLGLVAGSVDLIVTDPAYESLEKHRAKGTTTRLKVSAASSNAWFPIFPNTRFADFFAACWRVLAPNSHLYVYCDDETAYVIKPLAEAAGFKYWKRIVWDKCLNPHTPVPTATGVRELGTLAVGDPIATPSGGFTPVRAIRTVRAAAVRVRLSDGTTLEGAHSHRVRLFDGRDVELGKLYSGVRLATDRVTNDQSSVLASASLIPAEAQVVELPPTTRCLWCSAEFGSPRAAAAHQARFCQFARSKERMAKALGVPLKRLQWWMAQGQIPAAWATALGVRGTGRVRMRFANDSDLLFPEQVELDYSLGKVVGLYAAQGSHAAAGVTFAFNAEKRDSHAHVARYARSLGMHSTLRQTSENGVSVDVGFAFMAALIDHFVCGRTAGTKAFAACVYSAPDAFRMGVFDGLNDGDGHWEWAAQRDAYTSSSLDLSLFVLRHAREQGWAAAIHRFENATLGGWRVNFDRSVQHDGLCVENVEACGVQDLIDVAIDAPHLFLLGNGGVTHNCKIGMGYHFRARCEYILFFEKGKRKLNDLGMPDTWDFKEDPEGYVMECARIANGYPTEKPVVTSERLILQSSQPGDIVCDPFLGSGSVGEAALRTGRRFVGCDIQPGAVAGAHVRLAQVVAAIAGSPVVTVEPPESETAAIEPPAETAAAMARLEHDAANWAHLVGSAELAPLDDLPPLVESAPLVELAPLDDLPPLD